VTAGLYSKPVKRGRGCLHPLNQSLKASAAAVAASKKCPIAKPSIPRRLMPWPGRSMAARRTSLILRGGSGRLSVEWGTSSDGRDAQSASGQRGAARGSGRPWRGGAGCACIGRLLTRARAVRALRLRPHDCSAAARRHCSPRSPAPQVRPAFGFGAELHSSPAGRLAPPWARTAAHGLCGGGAAGRYAAAMSRMRRQASSACGATRTASGRAALITAAQRWATARCRRHPARDPCCSKPCGRRHAAPHPPRHTIRTVWLVGRGVVETWAGVGAETAIRTASAAAPGPVRRCGTEMAAPVSRSSASRVLHGAQHPQSRRVPHSTSPNGSRETVSDVCQGITVSGE
jgi:hypothetical protein